MTTPCDCKDQCANRREMKARHGTPEAFAEATWMASDCLMITPSEARAAVAKYREQWASASE